ncbi:MAG: hypothetical protein ACTHK4_14910, partial [Mycobacteriales bacterium]
MTQWQQTLSDIAAGEFVALFVLAVWQWLRYRARGAAWAAGSFGLLALISVTGLVLEHTGELMPPTWLIKTLLAAVLLVPYALYRFAASFVPVRWGRLLAEVLTAAAVIGTLVIPYLPYPGQASPPGFIAYRLLVALQWGSLFGFVALRMWRAGTHQPRAARMRMRLLAIAAAGLDIPLVISALGLGYHPNLQLASSINTAVMAVLFGLGLTMPGAIRSWWRTRERNAMQVAVADLVSAYSVPDVASGLLPHVAALTGAADITLVDSEGIEIAQHRSAHIPTQRQPTGSADDTVPIE